MTEPREEDREPPRLQDTTERSALPLPLPDGEDPVQPADPAAPETPPADAPPPADKAPSVDAPGTAGEEAVFSGNGAEAAPSPPFDPFAQGAAGPRPEVLLGAAFAGGVVLALLIRRLGR